MDKICLGTMDSFSGHTQECRRFRSDWFVHFKHANLNNCRILGSFTMVATLASAIVWF